MAKTEDTLGWYKKSIWIYFILLLFEGALRKWLIPVLATPLLLVREPIVIVITVIAFNKGLIKVPYVLTLIIVSTLSFVLSITLGHQNLLTAIYGWRIYLLHIPFIFVIAKILNRGDILQMGRFMLYLSIPMTLLIIAQFYSPQAAWINRGVGGDMEGAGFSGAMGYMRPSGTFSFTAGYVMYQLIVAVFLFYYLVNNRFLPKEAQIRPSLLYAMLACYALTIPYSISRSHLFQTIVVIAFMFVGVLLHPVSYVRIRLLKTLPIAILSIGVIMWMGIAGDSLTAFEERFESANETEGGIEGVVGSRYFGSFIRGLVNADAPFFGYGLGLGTNVGANLAGGSDGLFSFFNGEEEWVRMTSESGLLLGWVLIGLRLYLSGWIAFNTLRRLRQQKDMLPWMLTAGVLLTLPQGQIGMPTNLGFMVLLSGLALASLRSHKKRKLQYGD
ncbi:hypothetical protein BC792_12246 [Sphingobacterium allocomposti]|uniref:O-antigen ligase-like membrane protein n=1 Tax=Sphingobacterium allocomposti TaxID=415956 RepID=A0A5S5D944_9SPHI|nr:hypothetical protein [Sphingobacterium composti Yoo et al. 2007 non Ten et al. 2007]TYP91079.1 hypothetical protein BC792_12246 [Sphingobacterium composti Yoo et al. 2007 non Ten et al. 2007]